MSTDATIGVGVIGLGFMGRTHARAYNAAREAGHPCRLAAVCDGDAERLDGRDVAQGNIESATGGGRLWEPSELLATTDPDELLADDSVAVVSVCTPTESHVDLAIRALEAGKHVLVEKPVAVTSAEVRRLLEVSSRTDRHCLPAFCMRFWPGWTWLKERVEDGAHGPVQSAVFRRLGNPPGWSSAFYQDPARTGGALVRLDTHHAP